MLIIAIETILIVLNIIMYFSQGVSILTIGLTLLVILIPMVIIINYVINTRKEKERTVDRVMNYLGRQVRETLIKRTATELQRADMVSKKNMNLIEAYKKKEIVPRFDLNASIINGEEERIELRLLSSKLANESSKDRLDKNVL